MSKRKLFTWKELSKFRHVSNVHVAYEGKVGACRPVGVQLFFVHRPILNFSVHRCMMLVRSFLVIQEELNKYCLELVVILLKFSNHITNQTRLKGIIVKINAYCYYNYNYNNNYYYYNTQELHTVTVACFCMLSVCKLQWITCNVIA